MKLKDEFAMHRRIQPIRMAQMRRLLDFHDKAVNAMEQVACGIDSPYLSLETGLSEHQLRNIWAAN